nr:MAG TPA: hypothetical protein [Caudoviricetes sp.]
MVSVLFHIKIIIKNIFLQLDIWVFLCYNTFKIRNKR